VLCGAQWALSCIYFSLISDTTHTHPINGPLSGTTRVSRYQKGITNLDFAEARNSERQWHQPGHMQVCASLQTDNHASTSPLSFLQAGCPSCRPTNSLTGVFCSFRFNFPEGRPDANFDSFTDALLTVFQVDRIRSLLSEKSDSEALKLSRILN